MSLFICDCCGNLENSVNGNIWFVLEDDTKPALCHRCLTGKWHDMFIEEKATKKVMDRIGYDRIVEV